MGGEAGCGGGGGGAPNGPSFGSPACSASSTRDPARTHPRGGRRCGRGPGGGGGPQASQPSPRQPPSGVASGPHLSGGGNTGGCTEPALHNHEG